MTEIKAYTDLQQAVKNSRDHETDWTISSKGMSLQVSRYVEYARRACICLTRDDHIATSYTMESGYLSFKPDQKDTKSERLLKAIDGLTTIFQKSKAPHVVMTSTRHTFGEDPSEVAFTDLLKKRLGFYDYDGGSFGYCNDLVASSETIKKNLETWKKRKIGKKTVYERLQERVKVEYNRKCESGSIEGK